MYSNLGEVCVRPSMMIAKLRNLNVDLRHNDHLAGHSCYALSVMVITADRTNRLLAWVDSLLFFGAVCLIRSYL